MAAPWPVSKIQPTIIVYTRDNKDEFSLKSWSMFNSIEVAKKVGELEKAGFFAPDRQVVFVTHGFWNNQLFDWLYKIKDNLLTDRDSTVFIVTWGSGAILPSYTQASLNTQTVAGVIAEFASAILKKTKTFNGKLIMTARRD